jgi:hypothetical protein
MADWFDLDEANKRDGHYNRVPEEIRNLETSMENAVNAFNTACDEYEKNPTIENQNRRESALQTMLTTQNQLRNARRNYHAKK